MTNSEYIFLNTLFCPIDDEDEKLRAAHRRYLDRYDELVDQAEREGIDLEE